MTKFNNAPLYMILDKVTGKPEMVPPSRDYIVSREDAEASFTAHELYFGDRYVIVKLACLVPGETPND
jgi:hypothetical protein